MHRRWKLLSDSPSQQLICVKWHHSILEIVTVNISYFAADARLPEFHRCRDAWAFTAECVCVWNGMRSSIKTVSVSQIPVKMPIDVEWCRCERHSLHLDCPPFWLGFQGVFLHVPCVGIVPDDDRPVIICACRTIKKYLQIFARIMPAIHHQV